MEDVSGWRTFRDRGSFGMENVSGWRTFRDGRFLSCRTFCNWNIADRDLVYIRDDFVMGRFAIGTFVTWTMDMSLSYQGLFVITFELELL